MTAARALLLSCLAVVPAALAQPPAPGAAPAAAPARPKILHGQDVELSAVDGWKLKGVWLKAMSGKPTLVLVHGTGKSKESWRLFTRFLEHDGYGYLAFDLRGHGESHITPTGETITWKKLRAAKDANDYEDMARDVEAAVSYLVQQGLTEEQVGLVGAEVGGSLAIKYAAVHPKVPFVIALSPGIRWQEVLTPNALFALKGRAMPLLFVYSEKDKRSSHEAPLMYSIAKNSVGETHAGQIVVANENGTQLFKANRGLTSRVLAWIANPVPPASAPAPAAAPTPGVAGSTVPASVLPAMGEEEDEDSDAFSGPVSQQGR